MSATPKSVRLSFLNGRLQTFLNNWPLYRIGGEPKISKEEAIDIALNASKNYSYKIKNESGILEDVSGFKIASVGEPALYYLNYEVEDSPRGGDSFTLFPEWYVPLGFDKYYLGGVTGMTVRIWADTGEVSRMGYMGGPLVAMDNAKHKPPQQ